MKDFLKLTFLLMLKHYYQVSYQISIHVLLRLKENWKKFLDNKDFADTVLMDLSKAFGFIPHDLLVAKFHASSLSKDTPTFVELY